MPSVCYVNWKEDRNSPEVLTSDDLETILKKKILVDCQKI